MSTVSPAAGAAAEVSATSNADPARRWIAAGLWGLPIYGALTLWSSIEPQPDPATQYDAWAHFVTQDAYVVGHLLGSGLGLIAGIFGSIALGAALMKSRAATLGGLGMLFAALGAALFLMPMGVSAFSAPQEGLTYHTSGVRAAELPASLASTLFASTFLAVIVLGLVGNVLLGIAVWRSKLFSRWAGALWAFAPVLMYPLGVVYALLIGVASTPPTVPLGAALMVVSGAWIALAAQR